jgi:hypothetical protein
MGLPVFCAAARAAGKAIPSDVAAAIPTKFRRLTPSSCSFILFLDSRQSFAFSSAPSDQRYSRELAHRRSVPSDGDNFKFQTSNWVVAG